MATKKAQDTRQPRKALVVGGANTVWDDLTIALREFSFDAVFVVNDIGTIYEDRIDFWVSLHPEKMYDWQSLRRKHGLNDDYVTYAHELPTRDQFPKNLPRIDKSIDYRYPGMTGSGSSGLMAVKAAQLEGFDRIVLAGIPMTIAGRHFFSKDLWHEHGMFVAAWKIALPHIKREVRSLSGWTRELLGSPSSTWLAGGDQ